MTNYQDYGFKTAGAPHTMRYLLPRVFQLAGDLPKGTRVLDIGCGNGYVLGKFLEAGCTIVGVDLGEQGIQIARESYPNGRFEVVSADDDILSRLNEPPFDLVISTETIEHLYSPRIFAKQCYSCLKPGGRFICSTPYHGYLKNLVLAIMNKWDKHADPLWDGGHIKLWSRQTLGELLRETGFANIQFAGAGRLPYLWMSMVMSGDKPA